MTKLFMIVAAATVLTASAAMAQGYYRQGRPGDPNAPSYREGEAGCPPGTTAEDCRARSQNRSGRSSTDEGPSGGRDGGGGMGGGGMGGGGHGGGGHGK